MAHNQSVRDVSNAIASRAALRGVFGRPQKLSFVGPRLYWLEGATQELFCQELEGGTLVGNPCRAIVLSKDTAAPGQHLLTKEEELLRERQRTLSEGISWYHIRERDHRVAYLTSLNLYLYSPVHGVALRVLDYVSDSNLRALFQGAPCLNMQLVHGCKEQDVFTFVCQFNVYRLRIKECTDPWSIEVLVDPITSTGKPQLEFGTADYIMQEEFDRYTGQCARAHHVLMLHTDTTMLSTVKLAADNTEQVESIVFPRVGDANAKSSVVVATTGSVDAVVVFRTVPHHIVEQAFLDDNQQPLGVEYVTRFGFIDDNTIFFQVLDRRQENAAIFECDIASLPVVEEQHAPRSSRVHLDSSCTPMLKLLYRKSCPRAWVEITNALLLDLQQGGMQIVGDHVLDSADGSMYFHLLARKSSEAATGVPFVPITHGKWNVRPSSVVTGAKQGDIFFLANRENRLGIGLYVIQTTTDKTTNPELLSLPHELVHSFAVGGTIVAYVASTADSLATLRIVDRSQTSSRAEVHVEWPLRKSTELLTGLVKSRIFTFLNPRQVPISGALFLPPNTGTAARAAPVPLMMYVYGGPHVQLVHDNNLELACNPVVQTLVHLGIAVAIVDNQMSNANDLVAHSVCKHRMGRFEVEEYVSWKRQLCSAPELSDCIDPTRVGIFGWSYGGYVTLLAMAQAADEFKIGFAGAPVGDWKLYDTGYTERYMGLLTDAEATGYDQGRIAAFASGFPDELDRVFLAHGLLDENVHFSHSCDVINALIEQGKPYSMLVYPGERHGLRQKKVSRPHYDALLIKTVLMKL